ncbi:uncharacterized protein L969DRAFT_92111 [Mixia osmundae IAM 14324]|uniref:polynucleotide adenylyltransferase n=1 Tax=Mixia osmundae (strain CBS 9802 / IAM 14324 / JCM 22182 / KY 12970) TaxID=764103 RepID=G7E554_MIXOS|nr:uncharacterized protein L969DRAFT_92111 [Mixia osmundae IAM 14324]KEI42679.1 hypothetical protein L969DRAFT_92111 [Mixia osmundae IAM 14324]GAA97964.1 hypothetical protein E5Q_04644 [Mixia osmundae IAM 14324]
MEHASTAARPRSPGAASMNSSFNGAASVASSSSMQHIDSGPNHRYHGTNRRIIQPTSSPSHANITAELSAYLQSSFLPSVLPTADEYQMKEQTRIYLQTLANRVSPGAKLLPFGSMANGFALRNSDMDLCCFRSETERPQRSSSELVEILGRIIEQETDFEVKMLPRARIPIIKLSKPPSPGVPFGLQCDIGFDNRLAMENTRLLLTYARVDPRLRTIVLFLKVWTKARKINSPYTGTLSSYGYVLLVIHFLTNVRKPAVLPNLQRLPPPRAIPVEELEIDGHDIYFYDDLDSLDAVWSGTSKESVGELLVAFFRYYSQEFRYAWDVISPRTEGGILTKESKGWQADLHPEDSLMGGPRELNKLCIEDPFQTDYNVARTVTKDGIFTIRGEMMRAVRIVTQRTAKISSIIAELTEERSDQLIAAPPGAGSRRRSAPSPRLGPTVYPQQSAADFRTWLATSAGMAQTAGPMYTGRPQQLGGHLEEAIETSPNNALAPQVQDSTPRQDYSSGRQEYVPSRYRHAMQYSHTLAPINGYRRPRQPHSQKSQSPNSHQSNGTSFAGSQRGRRMSWDGVQESTVTNDFDRFFQVVPDQEGTATMTAPVSPAMSEMSYNFRSLAVNGHTQSSPLQSAVYSSSDGDVPVLDAGLSAQSSMQSNSQPHPTIKFGNFHSPLHSPTPAAAAGLGLFEMRDHELAAEAAKSAAAAARAAQPPAPRSSSSRNTTLGAIHPEVDNDTLLFGGIRVVRRREESDKAMAALMRSAVQRRTSREPMANSSRPEAAQR